MNDLSHVVVSSSPHLKNREDTRSIMLDVLIALAPSLAVAMFVFGMRALTVTVVACVVAVLTEYLYNAVVKKPQTIGDLSAVVTGVLLAFNLPVGAPLWISALGSFFAIIVVKCIFGGIGKNFMNPALAARAFLMASFPGIMATFTEPFASLHAFATPVDAVAAATPLAQIKEGAVPDSSILDMAIGQIGGCLGETSAIALIIGGVYLVYRKVITITIPATYILTVAIITFLFPLAGMSGFDFMLTSLFSGGLMLGAIFMATDYTTSPVTPKGQIIFGVGLGLLTVFIRYLGGYPEGVSYSILIMNTMVWLIDKYTRPRKFGYTTEKKEKKEA